MNIKIVEYEVMGLCLINVFIAWAGSNDYAAIGWLAASILSFMVYGPQRKLPQTHYPKNK